MSMYQHFEQVCNILNIDVNQLFEGAILGKLLVNQISQDTKDEITNILTNGIRLNERMSRNRLLKCNYFKKLNQIMNCQEPEEIVKPEETIENEEDYVDILGIFDRDELIYDPHAKWFKENYDNYQIDELTAKKIQPLIKDIEITVFMGTWCSDSRRDSPAFFKLMDYIKTYRNFVF